MTETAAILPSATDLEEREAARLAALRRYDILDTPPDGSFDHIAQVAARLFDVPIAIISLVDTDRIWFKAKHGLDVDEIGRDPGLCASAIMQSEPYLLTDASCDPRSLANPLVAGEFGLRFYLASPLQTTDGYNLGTICVIDRKPRVVTEQQINHLQALARVVMDQIELRLAARTAVSDLQRAVEQKDAALERSRMLAKEIDHRVMNSLQQVSALLNLQSRHLDDEEAARQLQVAAARVTAVARVHQHIFQSADNDDYGCLGYLERLCADLERMMGGHSILIEGTDVGLPIEKIAPIGLLVNELVTNAFKNGANQVRVSLDPEDSGSGRYRLSLSDDGAGFPADFDPQKTSGLGMKVVRMVVRQLGGTLDFGRCKDLGGALVTIRFPLGDEVLKTDAVAV
jgi:two-component sensor histidine kinase